MQRKSYSTIWILALFLLAALVLAIPLGAQDVTASITGNVTDASGAAIVGATVVARDLDRGTAYSTATDAAGFYNLARLPGSRYEVKVTNAGFEASVQPSVELVINQVAKLDFQLKVGNVNQTVEVTSAAPILQTETTTLGTVLQSDAITSLPLETRNYNQLTLLIPGAVTTSPGAFNGPQSTFNSGRPYINGNREQANYYLLDGMENVEFVDNNVAYAPNVDAIEEFNVVTNNPSADYGQFLGGVISVITKSGTNSYHGDAFEFLRNDAMNANEWQRNLEGLSSPQPLRWNEFGGTFGGPIKKNKLFFFVDYQGSRFDHPPTVVAMNTFTGAEKNLDFTDMFTALGTVPHYPGTNVNMPTNLNDAAKCGANETMGVNPCITISPTALKVLAALPTSTGSGVVNNAVNSESDFTNGDQGDAKLDWVPTDNDHLSVRYSQQNVVQQFVNSQQVLYSTDGNENLPLWSGVINYTKTLSPTLLNEFRVGVNYFPAEGNLQPATSSNLGALVPGEPTNYLPGFFFSGAPLGGGQNGPFAFGTVDAPEIFHQTAIQAEDTAILTRGAHNMKFGFQFIRYRNDYIPSVVADGAAGQIGFNGTYTGNAETDFILGLPSYMGYGTGYGSTVGQRNSAIGAYFQDDWKLSPKLTLNLGLRWQLFTPIYEVGNRETNVEEYTGKIELAGVGGVSSAMYNQYNGIANFLPRVGLAWNPIKDTVLRAAFSRSSFQEGTGEYNRLATNAPWNEDLSGQWSGANGIPSNQVTLDQGFAALGSNGAGCTVENVTSAPAACFAGTRIHMTDPDYRPAVSNQWNFSIQRQFGSATTVQAAYVGQHSDHLATIIDAGQGYLASPGVVLPSPYLAGNPALVADGLGQVRLNATVGIQNYNALQIAFQQRLSRGLSFQANYTWSKCLTDNFGYYGRYGDAANSQASADVAFQQNAYDILADYGYCDHDVTNVFNGYLAYQLPFGKGRQYGSNVSPVLDAVLGGWNVNTVFTVHGGFPISMLDWAGDPGTGSFQPRPNCNGPSIATPYQENPASLGGGYVWFGTANMSNPPAGYFGNCGVSTERGPGLAQVDIGVDKNFTIRENQYVQFRAEAINAFNTPVLDVVGYSIDVYGGSGAGVVNTSQGARNLQVALKYVF
ncbi:MAG: carboxypeptidase regulatory-like domain-containing protein [Bryobacteraceae bacterium]